MAVLLVSSHPCFFCQKHFYFSYSAINESCMVFEASITQVRVVVCLFRGAVSDCVVYNKTSIRLSDSESGGYLTSREVVRTSVTHTTIPSCATFLTLSVIFY